jgi:DNA-binding CsgD family transcriptional regulator
MPDPDLFIAPDIPPVTISLEPALNAILSILLLIKTDKLSGLDDWVVRTANALTPKEREVLRLIAIGFHYALVPERRWPSFPAYLEHLETCEPGDLRDKLLRFYARVSPTSDGVCKGMAPEPLPIDRDAILHDAHTYVNFLAERFGRQHVDEALESRAYSYVVDPPAMQELIVSHLRAIWERHLAAEWERVQPMLQDAVSAFRQIDLHGMTKRQAAEEIAGRALEEKWQASFEPASRIVFVPSAHVGPYLLMFCSGDVLSVAFGARLPKGVQISAPDLSRAEILVRLNALSDDNRLRILRLIAEQGEQRSTDIISHLGLSQSTASRHLKQLVAIGYLQERRCNGAKCYKLCPEQISDTLGAISSFLGGPSHA